MTYNVFGWTSINQSFVNKTLHSSLTYLGRWFLKLIILEPEISLDCINSLFAMHELCRSVQIFFQMIFSERELKFMFAICHRRSVCRLSVVCCL